ncbi:hypothetical protein M427DRAFT_53423 [Gonapodya prolifera JEL478]|uniref:C2H2-type domain-containing protein n=1 Tax=Gonapodya prolifera (strain JEL478) TaxID=1344416 RepID=A0A139AQF7_GONPJ|nr:hypothetical protein M427DRAFT_53423 [Gonapodya prolifera JEL478]|eukprot:KXS18952.1 hypothetical protein M427DRAFT_53423 [Gonapodya prolifera JEL478]
MASASPHLRPAASLPAETVQELAKSIAKTSDGKYLCPVANCNKICTTRFNCRAHLSTHIKDRPHAHRCQRCGTGFHHIGDLNRHETRCAGKIPACKWCGVQYGGFVKRYRLHAHEAKCLASVTGATGLPDGTLGNGLDPSNGDGTNIGLGLSDPSALALAGSLPPSHSAFHLKTEGSGSPNSSTAQLDHFNRELHFAYYQPQLAYPSAPLNAPNEASHAPELGPLWYPEPLPIPFHTLPPPPLYGSDQGAVETATKFARRDPSGRLLPNGLHPAQSVDSLAGVLLELARGGRNPDGFGEKEEWAGGLGPGGMGKDEWSGQSQGTASVSAESVEVPPSPSSGGYGVYGVRGVQRRPVGGEIEGK